MTATRERYVSERWPGERPTAGIARVGDVEIFYDTFGDPAHPPLLLIMGLGAQMIIWPETLCEMLADAGFFVVRFDNRDAGRSSHFEHAAAGPLLPAMARRMLGASVTAPYALEDMVGDTVGLLDHLDLEGVHIWGISMGGMIGQTLAIRHPRRVRSLVSMMSSTGNPWVGMGKPRALRVLLRRRVTGDRDGYAAQMVEVFRIIGSPGFPFEPEVLRERFLRAWDRGVSAASSKRQMLAILASGDRTADLRRLDVPTLVVHGRADPLIAPRGGRATARAIPGARLVVIDGMGHDLPRPLWPRFLELVGEHIGRAERDRTAPVSGPAIR